MTAQQAIEKQRASIEAHLKAHQDGTCSKTCTADPTRERVEEFMTCYTRDIQRMEREGTPIVERSE